MLLKVSNNAQKTQTYLPNILLQFQGDRHIRRRRKRWSGFQRVHPRGFPIQCQGRQRVKTKICIQVITTLFLYVIYPMKPFSQNETHNAQGLRSLRSHFVFSEYTISTMTATSATASYFKCWKWWSAPTWKTPNCSKSWTKRSCSPTKTKTVG